MNAIFLACAMLLSLVSFGCAGGPETKAREATTPADASQEVKDRSQDASLLAGTGIDLQRYRYQYSSNSSYQMHQYTLLNASKDDLSVQMKKIVSATESLHARMPSVKDIAQEFGIPPFIYTSMSGANSSISIAYGDNASQPGFLLWYGPQTANISEIRFVQATPDYRFRGKLMVGSTFDEVFDLLGKPVETVKGKDMVQKDRVFAEAILEGGYPWQFIGYAADGVRFFGTKDKVTSLYLFDPKGQMAAGLLRGGTVPAQASSTASPVSKGPVESYADLRNKDLTAATGDFGEDMIRSLWYHEGTVFPAGAAPIAKRIMDDGTNPGLGVRALHARGITGKGVKVAIIDQNLVLDQAMMPDHPEYKGKVVQYKDVGTKQPANQGSMHGPAVLSLLVGNTMGTAPDAKVYFAAAPSWTADAKYQADALQWIIAENRKLPVNDKIRVVSISAAPSGQGSPFTANNKDWDDAVKLAKAEGLLVLDCTQENGIIQSCYYDPKDPENVMKCTAGYPGMTGRFFENRILAPTSYRTQAEEYQAGKTSRQYTGRGGLSWSIPYAAGVFAMGWQVNPSLDADAMVKLLRESAAKLPDGSRVIDPPTFIAAVEKTR